MNQWSNRVLSKGYRALLLSQGELQDELHAAARRVAHHHFGRRIYIRGLIEISNVCRNDCYYCGLRRSNRELERYSLSHDEILSCCRDGYSLGFRTFVLQGGEDPSHSDEWLVALVSAIRKEFADCAITLSLGERSTGSYQRLFDAGANRYLLRHESHNAALYGRLHPESMKLSNRLRCLDDLKRIGYQTGSGIMVGAPTQSIDDIIEDIEYLKVLEPEMIGIGAFLPHHATPFGGERAGSLSMSLNLLALLRLLHPMALIPATTALATLAADGRARAILAGANVVMPNLSPPTFRERYSLYDGKVAFGAEAAEGLVQLEKMLREIGYELSTERGDAPKNV